MSREISFLSEINTETVGVRIRFIRKSKNESIRTFSKTIGISTGNLSDIEHDKYAPSFKVLVRISESYNIDCNWLLGIQKKGGSDESSERYKDPRDIQITTLNKEVERLTEIISKIKIVLSATKVKKIRYK